MSECVHACVRERVCVSELASAQVPACMASSSITFMPDTLVSRPICSADVDRCREADEKQQRRTQFVRMCV